MSMPCVTIIINVNFIYVQRCKYVGRVWETSVKRSFFFAFRGIIISDRLSTVTVPICQARCHLAYISALLRPLHISSATKSRPQDCA